MEKLEEMREKLTNKVNEMRDAGFGVYVHTDDITGSIIIEVCYSWLGVRYGSNKMISQFELMNLNKTLISYLEYKVLCELEKDIYAEIKRIEALKLKNGRTVKGIFVDEDI